MNSLWLQRTTPQANQIVQAVLRKHVGTPLSTQEIYKLSHKYSGDKAGLDAQKAEKELGITQIKPIPVPEAIKLRIVYDKRGARREQPPMPPHPEHPIRSVRCVFRGRKSSLLIAETGSSSRYLKTVVLPDLVATHKVEKIHTTRVGNAAVSSLVTKSKATPVPPSKATPVQAWLWQLRSHPPTPPKVAAAKPVYGAEVGVGEDWSHLSKRRRRSRIGKVGRDLATLKAWEKSLGPGGRAEFDSKMNERREGLKLKEAVEGNSGMSISLP